MPRKKVIIHDEAVVNFHTENIEPDSRLWKIVTLLAYEEEFNDPFSNIILTDDPCLLCESIGY